MIPTFSPNLEELDLSLPKQHGYANSDDDDWDDRSRYYSRSSQNDKILSNNGISVLASKLNGLRKINLQRNEWLSDKGVISLSKNCPNLEEIVFSDCRSVTIAGIQFQLQTCNNLKKIGLQSISYKPGDPGLYNYNKTLYDSTLFTLFEHCPMLQALEMKKTSLGKGKGSRDFVGSTSQIKTLNLSSNEHLSNKSLKKIASACPDLETLQMRSCPLISTSGVAKLFRECRHLRDLQIGGCLGVKKLYLRRKTPYKLEALGASKTDLSNEALIEVSENCPDLVFLDLRGCKEVTSKGVKEVVDKCTKLKEIKLAQCANLGKHIVPWMVFCKPNLRKIVPPSLFVKTNEGSLYLRHGCFVNHNQIY